MNNFGLKLAAYMEKGQESCGLALTVVLVLDVTAVKCVVSLRDIVKVFPRVIAVKQNGTNMKQTGATVLRTKCNSLI